MQAFPTYCVGCKGTLEYGGTMCAGCKDRMKRLKENIESLTRAWSQDQRDAAIEARRKQLGK